ncbi:MAG: hypothetical protein ACOH12_13090 [Parvibaculaceae bacterium]
MSDYILSFVKQCRRMKMLTSIFMLAMFAFTGAASARDFSGNFNGIAAAKGMVLSLTEVEGRLVGRLAAADGRAYALNGQRREAEAGKSVAGAQGDLRLGDVSQPVAYFRIEERPLGIQFLFIPVTSDGKPDMKSARDYSFLTQGVDVKSAKNFITAPQPGEKVDVLRFIDEFRQWDPRDVARIYVSLSEREKGLIQLYDHASADILWRVCATVPPNDVVSPAMVSELLDRQQVSCAQLMPVVKAAQKGGLFPEFLHRARFQFEIIRETTICNRGQSSPAKCADVSALGGPLIIHWRDAMSIMRELVPEGVVVEEVKPDPVQPEAAQAAVATVRPSAKDIPPVLALRESVADVPREKRGLKEIKKEGRVIAVMRRRGLHVPLRDPRI